MNAARIVVAALVALAGGATAAYGAPTDLVRGGHPHGGHCGHGHGNGLGLGHLHGHGHGHDGDDDCDDDDEGDGDGDSDGNGNGAATGATGGVTGGTGGATGGAGGAAGGQSVLGAAAADTTAPSFLARPRLHPTRFRAARRGASLAVLTGTTITYSLSEPAQVTFTVQKYRHLSHVCRRRLAARNARHRTGTRCRRWIFLKGRFAKASAAGPTSVRFRGRLKGRRLRPGAYRLVIRARDPSGNVTRPRRPNFRIVR